MATIAELQSKYPAAANIIAMSETGGMPWDETREVADLIGPDRAMASMIRGMDITVACLQAEGRDASGAIRDRAEMDTPDFKAYFLGKIGAM